MKASDARAITSKNRHKLYTDDFKELLKKIEKAANQGKDNMRWNFPNTKEWMSEVSYEHWIKELECLGYHATFTSSQSRYDMMKLTGEDRPGEYFFRNWISVRW